MTSLEASMHSIRPRIGLFFGLALLIPGIATAQEATPVADESGTILTLVERPDEETSVDLGEPGTSPGDLLLWGPNPLYDEANEVDSGAVTFGSCTLLNAAGDNHCMETILFPDGSTLEIQGVQKATGEETTTTIIGGSGTYRGATGTVTAGMSEDGTTWIKTFEIFPPDASQVTANRPD
jgi:hypothetical protein